MATKVTLAGINKRAQAIRLEHPKMKWNDAQKKASKELKAGTKVSGTPAKKKVGSTAAASHKTTVTVAAKKSTLTPLAKGKKLVKAIERLELQRKEERNKELKDLIQLQINKNHEALDKLKKSS